MEIKGKVHCFFEQSGTFKNEFIKLGIPAEDYDIQNNFGQTDHITDLFAEIRGGYDGMPSIFDEITKDDLILAFFPCIFFCENNHLYFTGNHMNLSRLTKKEKADTIIKRAKDREFMYEMVLKMFTVCDMLELRLVVENPYAAQHFLIGNFPYSATIIDKDRTVRGDYYKKPTQYWFLNCEPTQGCTHQKPTMHKRIASGKPGIKGGICSEDRSLISPDYARNFICDWVIGKSQLDIWPTLFSE